MNHIEITDEEFDYIISLIKKNAYLDYSEAVRYYVYLVKHVNQQRLEKYIALSNLIGEWSRHKKRCPLPIGESDRGEVV
jgi:Arc/MetJ-type ribon-helix-helix transcriptional regulator